MKLSKYFGNFTKAVKKSHNKTFFSKASKIFAEFKKVFNFEKFLIYVLKSYMCQLLLRFLNRESNPKCLKWEIF